MNVTVSVWQGMKMLSESLFCSEQTAREYAITRENPEIAVHLDFVNGCREIYESGELVYKGKQF